jgi:tRNA-dihydrouridine synthase B
VADLIQSIKGKALLAPLAGITNLPFRLIARSFGCSLCFTEMISANGLTRESKRTIEYLKTCAEDQPLGVQIFGADPEALVKAARIAGDCGADLIDINMGCPVRKVVQTGAGASLMRSPMLAAEIIEAVVSAVRIPVTVKIRAGWSHASINAVEIARIAENSGAAAVIVHGRTADQGFRGQADWRIIAEVREAVRIPVIGNGDIWKPQDAMKMLEETSCEAVMVGRGALGNPWIFQGITKLFAEGNEDYHPSVFQRYEIIKGHWEMESAVYGNKIADRTFRKHLLWYTKGLVGSSRFRDAVGKKTDKTTMMDELDDYFQTLTHPQAELLA